MADLELSLLDGGLARLVLDRAEKRNAISLAMWHELAATFERLGADPAVRALVIRGRGDHFSAGADIAEFERERSGPRAGARYAATVGACVAALGALPFPSFAAVQGYCLGGGCSLAMACDFRIAGRGARFGIPAARLGIVYSLEDTRNLVALVGRARASHILFAAERFTAEEALHIGFVDEVTEEPAETSALRRAARMAENSRVSIAGAKRLLRHLAQEALPVDAEGLYAQALASDDYREGVRAFLERRAPRFA